MCLGAGHTCWARCGPLSQVNNTPGRFLSMNSRRNQMLGGYNAGTIPFLEGNLCGKKQRYRKRLGLFKAMEINESSKAEMKLRT